MVAQASACCPSHEQAALWKVNGLFLAQLRTAHMAQRLRSGPECHSDAQPVQRLGGRNQFSDLAVAPSLTTWWSHPIKRRIGRVHFSAMIAAIRQFSNWTFFRSPPGRQLLWQFGSPFGNSDGNSWAIQGNSGTISAIRVCPEAQNVGNSAIRSAGSLPF